MAKLIASLTIILNEYDAMFLHITQLSEGLAIKFDYLRREETYAVPTVCVESGSGDQGFSSVAKHSKKWMKKLTNFTTNGQDLAKIGHNWRKLPEKPRGAIIRGSALIRVNTVCKSCFKSVNMDLGGVCGV